MHRNIKEKKIIDIQPKTLNQRELNDTMTTSW